MPPTPCRTRYDLSQGMPQDQVSYELHLLGLACKSSLDMGIFHEIECHFCAKKSCNWLVVVVVDVCIDTIIDMCVMKSKKYHEKKGRKRSRRIG